MSFDLSGLGWNARLQQSFGDLDGPGLVPARVAVEHRGSYRLLAAAGEFAATVPGKMIHSTASREDLPAVGDWVAAELVDEGAAVIRAVLPRGSCFIRKVAGGEVDAQVVAANVDVVFILDPFDRGPNLRRIERYLTVAWESGATPVVVLTKKDLAVDAAADVAGVMAVAPEVDVHAVSCLTGDGLDELQCYLSGAPTIVALGPSGAGKSTLINAIVGCEVMRSTEVRHDGKGRHTTTRRELIPLPGGGALIDTPGMRELQLFEGDEGIDRSFSDIHALAQECRFRDCAHDGEPGCAVAEAIATGTLAVERLASYRKQLRELAAIARRKDRRLAHEEARKWQRLTRDARARARFR